MWILQSLEGGTKHPQEEIQRKAQGVSGGRPRKASAEDLSARGSWMGADKDTAHTHAKDPTPLPASTNKHRLFPIKDNTLRATPVIKPIILPLLRTVSSEDSLSSGHKATPFTETCLLIVSAQNNEPLL